MNCSQYDLKGYLLGEIAEAERRPVEGHLSGCRECREELARLRVAEAALRSVPDEEIPHKIAFVSDKVFEPGGWAWLWNSAPRLGFLSASLVAAAILVHAFVRPAPAVSPAQMAAIEARVRSEVIRSVEADLMPVLENFEMLQKRATVYYRASLEAGNRQ
ncbi:MAG TPA: zf-HC2 domain-containing protein [Bryobacteraceae bacterium]|nr:zf-HC2 domain-containing protein [Bryobacteraceae bacterium]